MSDRTENMKNIKRAINSDKHQRVAGVIAQITQQGRDDELKATIIARRAGVHRSFASNHFAAQITHAKAEIQARFITGLDSQTALTAASLRVEIETARQQARAAQQEIHQLKERLARQLGNDVATTRVTCEARSLTKASTLRSGAGGSSRLDARLKNATREPSADSDGRSDMSLPRSPATFAEARIVVASATSRT